MTDKKQNDRIASNAFMSGSGLVCERCFNKYETGQTVNKSSSGIGVQLKLFVNKVNNLDLKTLLVRV